MKHQRMLFLAAFGWILLIALGFRGLNLHATSPGSLGSSPPRWPEGIGLPFDRSRPNLIMAVHPRCPCSRASLSELERLLSQRRGQVSARILVYRPEGEADHWSWLGNAIEASARAGAEIVPDEGGRLALQLGIKTSGHVLLFQPSCDLSYSGGITPSRGHVGDNAGAIAVLRAIDSNAVRSPQGPVFGCSLNDWEASE